MLTAFKHFLKWALIPLLYFGFIIASVVTIFKRAEVGFFLLIAMIPQPNVWYKLHEYPFGKDLIDILFISCVLGMIIQKKGLVKTGSNVYIIIFLIISYLALWNASLVYSLPMPLTTSNLLFVDWKNYAEMILLYFLAVNILKDEKQQKSAVVLMAVVVLLISVRAFRNFSGGASFQYDKRVGGPFEAVGLGANHFGAFIASYSSALLGLFFLDDNRRRKILYAVAILFSLHPLFYSYSRGAYLAFFLVVSFYAVVKKRSLLIVVFAILVAWQAILPVSVVDRISMTTESETGELEGSASHRLDLWKHALDLFEEKPIFGVGFGAFGFTVPEGELTDTHNFYMKTLAEQGVIGITILFLVIFAAFRSAWRLIRVARTPFHKGLGFGFMGCVIAMVVTNMFGDRWSYIVLGGYFWIFWGLVDRSILISMATSNKLVKNVV